MFICPNCKVPLTKTKGAVGIFWSCPKCRGRSATVSLLRRLVPRETVNALWQRARKGVHPRRRVCPACNARMSDVPVPVRDGHESLDVCTRCHFIWFDPSEYEDLPKIERAPDWRDTLPQEAREQIARMEMERIRERASESDWGRELPDAWWKLLPGALGMPVEYDSGLLARTPWVTWLMTLLVTVVSVAAFFNLEPAVRAFGVIPAQWDRYGGLTLLTSFFLHGGILHLVSNMYFLLVFGDNVEDSLGRLRFLLLLFTATVVGDAVHVLGEPASATPCIGASGGISGVIVYYAIRFPRARLGFLVRFYYIFRWIRMPAYGLLLLWLAMQIVGAMAQLSGFSNVSSLAHLGGASVGFMFWFLTRHE